MEPLSIGEASKRSACNIETIRYYERIGLLPNPPRSQGGHRLYDDEQLKRLTFVRRARGLGFSLDEVRSLLRLVDSGTFSCAEVRAVTLDHRAEVRRKIADLKRLDAALGRLAEQCDGGAAPDCVIVDALFGAET